MSKKETPNCLKQRTFLNLFEVSNCDGCSLLRQDEEYKVGEHSLYIYHLDSGCILNKDLSKDDLTNSKKMKTFLKDAIIHQNEILVLWLDDFNPEKQELDFLNIMSFDLDVHIMTF